jgi:hypothetical protein
VSKALQIPLDPTVKQLTELPYTMSYIIRKRQQVDNLMEMPQDKRPPDIMIWDGKPEDIEDWIDKVYNTKKQEIDKPLMVNLDEIEG